MSFEIAKAGWLYRLSSVLRRWKRSWFVLYTDGILKFFESPDSHVAEEVFIISTKCLLIKSGTQVTNVTPPPGLNDQSLLMIVFTGDNTLTVCAESPDDMRAWQISLEQARVLRMADNPPPPPPYSVINGTPHHQRGYSSQTVTVVPGYPGSGYPAYPGSGYPAYYGTHPPPYVVQSPGQTTTIIYADQPDDYYRRGYRRGYDGTDVAMGVVAGAAVGSLMWGPLLWW